MAGRVFVPSNDRRTHNYDTAKELGEVVVLPDIHNPFDLARIQTQLRNTFGPITPEDTIILSGKYQVVLCLFMNALEDMNMAHVAIYDAKSSGYVRRQMGWAG